VGIDRLTIRQPAASDARVDLTFQRIGERVAVYPEGREPTPVPITAQV
jgi:hypothetical protein